MSTQRWISKAAEARGMMWKSVEAFPSMTEVAWHHTLYVGDPGLHQLGRVRAAQ